MGKVDETIIGFTVFENGVEYLGISEASLPEVSAMTNEIEGAGILGKYESPTMGNIETMSATLNFRLVTPNAIKLHEPRWHNLSLMAAQQQNDTDSGNTEIVKVKHNLTVFPKKLGMGKLASASTGDVSGEYIVRYFATFFGNVKQLEIDLLNYIYFVNGVDYMKDVRDALGK